MSQLLRSFAAIAVCVCLSSALSAATVAQWDFNGSPASAASTGSGQFSGYDGSVFFPFNPSQTGSPGDPTVGNNNAAGRSATAAGAASGSRGVQADTSTTNYTDLSVSWHLLGGYRTSRFYQIYATSDGVNYDPVPLGTGSTAAVLGANGETSQSATVTADGLVSLVTDDNMIPTGTTGDAFVYDLSYTFPSGSVYENNPNFGVRVGAVTNGTDFVSSFAGTRVIDAAKGYTTSTADGGGSVRYDMFTVAGTLVPEPSSLALSGFGLALIGLMRRKSRR